MFTNVGNVSIGRQTVAGFGMENIGGTIDEQVCLSGRVDNIGWTVIKKRYIPPESTCVIDDGPNVKVFSTIRSMPPSQLVQNITF